MSEEFKVEIVNPEKSFLSKEDVTEVVIPAFEGEMGILVWRQPYFHQPVKHGNSRRQQPWCDAGHYVGLSRLG